MESKLSCFQLLLGPGDAATGTPSADNAGTMETTITAPPEPTWAGPPMAHAARGQVPSLRPAHARIQSAPFCPA